MMVNITRNLYAEGFLEKLGRVYCDIQSQIYGYNYRLSLPRGFKEGGGKKFSQLLNFIKDNLSNLPPSKKNIDLYIILKDVIEENASLLWHEGYIFNSIGIERDFSEFNLPEKHTIKTQCMGQVFWWVGKDKRISISSMIERIKRSGIDWSTEFNPKAFGKKKIRESLSIICPIPFDERKGRPSKSNATSSRFDKITLIPGVYSKKNAKVHFPKLCYTIKYIAEILRQLGWDKSSVSNSKLIQFYINPLQLTFSPIIFALKQDWIDEVFKK